jgi:positive regulator of sigma E activity
MESHHLWYLYGLALLIIALVVEGGLIFSWALLIFTAILMTIFGN